MICFGRNTGVSSIVAVIVMVGICVALLAFASIIVFDLTESSVSDSPRVSTGVDVDNQDDKLSVSIIRNGNAERVFVRGDGISGEKTISDSEGETGTIEVDPDTTEGVIEIIAVVDGNEQIVNTREFNELSGTDDTPFFDITIQSIPTAVTSGDKINLDYKIDNTGASDGQQTIKFVVDSTDTDEKKDLSLNSGETFTGSFSYATSDSDKPKVSVEIASESETISRDVDIVKSGSKIQDWYDLDNIRNDLDKKYVLVNDLDKKTNGYSDVAAPSANGGKGFEPIGDYSSGNGFDSTFDGNGYNIEDLVISRPSESYVGLFSFTAQNAEVTNLNLINMDITGSAVTGGISGLGSDSSTPSSPKFDSLSITGTVKSTSSYAGGVVGYIDKSGQISNVDADVTIEATTRSGGIVGVSFSPITDSSSKGVIKATDARAGGISGTSAAKISNSYSMATVNSDEVAGGITGFAESNVQKTYFVGDIDSDKSAGGIAGKIGDGVVRNSYATGKVSGNNDNIGGIVGKQNLGGGIEKSFSAVDVDATGGDVGGIVGHNNNFKPPSLDESYWDKGITNQDAGGGIEEDYHIGFGDVSDTKPNQKMTGSSAKSNMNSLDFSSTWDTVSGEYPVLSGLDKETQIDNR